MERIWEWEGSREGCSGEKSLPFLVETSFVFGTWVARFQTFPHFHFSHFCFVKNLYLFMLLLLQAGYESSGVPLYVARAKIDWVDSIGKVSDVHY